MGKAFNDWNLIGNVMTMKCPETGIYTFSLWATFQNDAGTPITPYVSIANNMVRGTTTTTSSVLFTATLLIEEGNLVKFGVLADKDHNLGVTNSQKIHLQLFKVV